MAERSYPFDGGPGATISEDEWSYLAGAWQDDGVQAPGPWDTALKVTSANEALLLHIAPGHANISGIHYHLDAEKTIAFASNATTNPRIDRIVLKLNRVTNTVAFLYKQGTPAISPIPPTIDRSWASPEINIATFTVRANASNVLPAEVFDERDFIGRYMKVTENHTSMTEGQLGYKPTTGKFYAQGKPGSLIEIGAVPPPPDLTPYLTKASAASTYAEIDHQHDSSTYSGTLSFTSGFIISAYATHINGWGPFAQLSMRVRQNVSADLPSGTTIATIPSVNLRPVRGLQVAGFLEDTGPVAIQVNPEGTITYEKGMAAWTSNQRYMCMTVTYFCNGLSPW